MQRFVGVTIMSCFDAFAHGSSATPRPATAAEEQLQGKGSRIVCLEVSAALPLPAA